MEKSDDTAPAKSSKTVDGVSNATNKMPLKVHPNKNRKFFKSKPQRIQQAQRPEPSENVENLANTNSSIVQKLSVKPISGSTVSTNFPKDKIPPQPDPQSSNSSSSNKKIDNEAETKGSVKIYKLRGNVAKNLMLALKSTPKSNNNTANNDKFKILEEVVIAQSPTQSDSDESNKLKNDNLTSVTTNATDDTKTGKVDRSNAIVDVDNESDSKVTITLDDDSDSSISSIASQMSEISHFDLKEHMQEFQADDRDETESKTTDYISSDNYSIDEEDKNTVSTHNSDNETDSLISADNKNKEVLEEEDHEFVDDNDNKAKERLDEKHADNIENIVDTSETNNQPADDPSKTNYVHWRKRAALKASENLESNYTNKQVEATDAVIKVENKSEVNIGRRSLRSMDKEIVMPEAGIVTSTPTSVKKSKAKTARAKQLKANSVEKQLPEETDSNILGSPIKIKEEKLDDEEEMQEPLIRITRNMSYLHKMYGMSDESLDESDTKDAKNYDSSLSKTLEPHEMPKPQLETPKKQASKTVKSKKKPSASKKSKSQKSNVTSLNSQSENTIDTEGEDTEQTTNTRRRVTRSSQKLEDSKLSDSTIESTPDLMEKKSSLTTRTSLSSISFKNRPFKIKVPTKNAKKRKRESSGQELGDINDDVALIKLAMGESEPTPSKDPEVPQEKSKKRKMTEKTNETLSDNKAEIEVKVESREATIENKQGDLPMDVEIKTEPVDDDPFDSTFNVSQNQMFAGTFQCGDIIYGKLGAFPFWPCMVMEEESLNSHMRQISVNGKRHMWLYHVRFFGDNGRRSWIRQNMILPLTGWDDLKKIVEDLRQKPKIRRAKIRFYEIPAKLKKLWDVGMNEAISLLNKSIPERYEFFTEIFNKKRKQPKRLSTKPIVKVSSEAAAEVLVKQEVLSDPEVEDVKPRPKRARHQSSKSERSNSTPTRILKEDEIKKEKEVEPAPESIPIKLEMPNVEASSEYSLSDTDSSSKWSAHTSSQLSDESQKALYKRNGLFKGVPSEKVCQVCLLTVGVIKKCKGKCCGYFHEKCSENGGDLNEPDVDIVTIKSKLYVEPKGLNLDTSKAFENMTLEEKIDFKMREVMQPLANQTIYISSSSESESDDETTSERSGSQTPIIEHVTADDIIVSKIIKKKREDKVDDDFKCARCAKNREPKCFVCGKENGPSGTFPRKCSSPGCGKFYHLECLRHWPQAQFNYTYTSKKETFICPTHVCHTCVSDNPRGSMSKSSDKVVRCLQCPATYHKNSYCIPAGTRILSASQIICPRHLGIAKSKSKRYVINTTWCFICSKGGDLICCETCPTCVHNDCMRISLQDDDTYVCEDCQSGRLPLYDEIVWAKMGSYRWWPATILFPNDVPPNIKNLPHNTGEFVVRFFGTHNYYWIGNGRVFLFQEGDSGAAGTTKKRVDKLFQQSVEEAAAAHTIKQDFKRNTEDIIKTGLKPPPYIRIKVNKPVGNVKMFDGNVSSTNPCNCDVVMENPCGLYTSCINRLLNTECDPEVCPAGDLCQNQKFEKRIYPPLEPYNTSTRGWGLKSLTALKKGQFIIEYVGEIIDDQEYQRRINKMHEKNEDNYYFLTIDKDRIIDAGPKGNLARFMNHCCLPNCETQKWNVKGYTRVGLFALEDIPPNTELTFNYNLQCVGEDKKVCQCGAPTCTGYIGAKSKIQNEEKKSKKKKKQASPARTVQTQVYEPCFICGDVGDTHPCINKICTKTYHLKCVNLESWPSKWACPCHNCNICTKRTIRSCVKCTNSYCPPHSEGNIRYDKLIGFVCAEHDPSKETQVVEANVVKSSSKIHTSTEEGDVTSTTTEEAEEAEKDLNKNSNKVSGKKSRRKGGKAAAAKEFQVNSSEDFFEKTLDEISIPVESYPGNRTERVIEKKLDYEKDS